MFACVYEIPENMCVCVHVSSGESVSGCVCFWECVSVYVGS
jgi:hypothetical protein